MAQIINTEIFEEDGIKYQRDIYDSGAVITYPWVDPDAPIPEPEPVPQEPTDTEILMDAVATLYEEILALKKGGE